MKSRPSLLKDKVICDRAIPNSSFVAAIHQRRIRSYLSSRSSSLRQSVWSIRKRAFLAR